MLRGVARAVELGFSLTGQRLALQRCSVASYWQDSACVAVACARSTVTVGPANAVKACVYVEWRYSATHS